MTATGLHCFVSGRVQGVFYRASTQKKAITLGLTGWACNLPDGRVEVLAFGDSAQLKLLHEWLYQGPPAAQVTAVEFNEAPFEAHTEFKIR